MPRSGASGIASVAAAFAADVCESLARQPRELPSRYLYDPLGSALFEAICRLPWYRITRAELRLIEAHAAAVFGALDPLSTIVELGSGSGDKLVRLIEAAGRTRRPLTVHLIDVSPSALDASARALSSLGGVEVAAHDASYESGLDAVSAAARGGGRRLVLLLGSNIGNFDPSGADELLGRVRAAQQDGDGLLIGADLVKPERELLVAYDDPLGVTAAFNRNLLVRINRELGGDFDLEGFAHRAVRNGARSRMEMHLTSLRRQRVRIPAAGLDFTMRAGETIWTESSYKYQPDELDAMLERAGFRTLVQWIDSDAGFALTLGQAVPTRDVNERRAGSD